MVVVCKCFTNCCFYYSNLQSCQSKWFIQLPTVYHHKQFINNILMFQLHSFVEYSYVFVSFGGFITIIIFFIIRRGFMKCVLPYWGWWSCCVFLWLLNVFHLNLCFLFIFQFSCSSILIGLKLIVGLCCCFKVALNCRHLDDTAKW